MFERPSYISEEGWNQKFPTYEDVSGKTSASPLEVQEALDEIAKAEGVKPSPPWVTISLITANAVLFLAGVVQGVDFMKPDIPSLTRWGANFGPLVLGGQWWRLFTCMFLHVGFIHLVFNMATLWYIGKFIERFLGRTGFSIVYLLAGLGGSLVSLLWMPGRVSAGASGAIFGLYGALFGFLTKEGQCVPATVRHQLMKSAVLFIIYNMANGLRANGIDMAAHIGGLSSGWLCGVAIALPTTPSGVARRPLTNALTLGVGLAIFGTMIPFLPRMAGPAGGLVLGEKAEDTAINAYTQSISKFKEGQISNIQFAEVLESKVIPGLAECRVRFESAENVPGLNPDKLRAVAECTQKRIIAFSRMAEAIRKNDAAGAQAAYREEEDAVKALQTQQ